MLPYSYENLFQSFLANRKSDADGGKFFILVCLSRFCIRITVNYSLKFQGIFHFLKENNIFEYIYIFGNDCDCQMRKI